MPILPHILQLTKTPCLFFFSILFMGGIAAPRAFSQADTAHHREVYATINQQAKTYRKQTVQAEVPDLPYTVEVVGWFDQNNFLRKISTSEEDHGVVRDSEYYFDGAEMIFAYQVTRTPTSGGAGASRQEDRFYFRDGVLFKWLDAHKSPVPSDSRIFMEQEEILRHQVPAFMQALGVSPAGVFADMSPGAGSDPPSPGGAPAKERLTEGRFQGIEQGDYFYLQIAPAGAEPQSLMILRADGFEYLVENPEAYLNRTIRVRWQREEVSIPEAGGAVPMDVVKGVELLP